MKRIGSIYIILLFLLSAPILWGQAPDSTRRDSLAYRSVVSDRINEVDERERGPSLAKVLKKADDAFGKKNFSAAMRYYGFVLKAEPLHPEALKGYGESGLAVSLPDSAIFAFQRMVSRGISPSPDYFPKMRLAEAYFRKGKYSEASELYNEVASLPQTPPIPEDLKRIANEQFELCLWAQGEGLDNPYIIQNDTTYLLDTLNVNTRELYSEYVASVQDGQLFFSAYRFDLKKDRANPKRNTIKILKAEDARKELGPDKPMVVTETEFNDLKRQHSAHLSFNKSGDVVYFALGDYVRDSADIRFELYRRKKTDGVWGAPQKLNTSVNAPGFTSTEPSVGTLPGNVETLFFVSDRPGGKGGRDIWHSRIMGDSLLTPKPLAEVNTVGNDVTPFYHDGSNTLFFSTDSLRTLGGFDVYKTRIGTNGRWKKAEHMGEHINSSANDVFFVLDKHSQRGYFSSNRSGSMNDSEEACCYDIYMVEFLKQYRAIALHDLKRTPLAYTKISLYEPGQKIPVASPAADSLSSYNFNVDLNKNYTVIGQKEGFRGDTVPRLTPEELWTSELVDTLYLRPLLNLVVSVYDLDTREPLNGAKASFWDIGTQPKVGDFVLNTKSHLSEVLPKNSNTQTYSIDFGHKYQVWAEKDGYIATTISNADSSDVISTVELTDGGTIEVKLYLHKPSALETDLPITLYFDNDYPKRTRATDDQLANVTDPFMVKMRQDLLKNPKDVNYHDSILIDYQKTFVEYIRKKDSEYKPGFSLGLSGDKKQAALDTIENFFENEVRYNWNKFFALSDKIDTMLQNGDTIILTLKGYASPLSNPEYNKHLTNRRIASVYNHFMIFDGGAFKKYREIVGNGQLRFIREANGDTESVKQGINGDPKDRRMSVYDTHASRSRRVQIIGARVSKGSKEKKRI
jgi:tetratricopeptide (TPR) repeat protein